MKRKIAVLFVGLFAVLGVVFLARDTTAGTRQQDAQGSVTIYLNDGTVWGYYGNVSVTYDRTGSPEVTLENAWLVGSTHPDFQVEGLKGEEHRELETAEAQEE